ncbi:hypothetical protein ACWCHM_29885 [Micromonospora sp. SCSIO 07396]
MGCGNNNVGRELLSSGPVSPEEVLAAMIRAAPVVPPPPVRLPRAPQSAKWGRKEPGEQLKQMFYGAAEFSELDAQAESTVHAFIGPDHQPTVDPNRHIHVIHDEAKKSVTLVITDRTQSGDPHLLKMEIADDPPGKLVNQAIHALVEVMNAIPEGPRHVEWP